MRPRGRRSLFLGTESRPLPGHVGRTLRPPSPRSPPPGPGEAALLWARVCTPTASQSRRPVPRALRHRTCACLAMNSFTDPRTAGGEGHLPPKAVAGLPPVPGHRATRWHDASSVPDHSFFDQVRPLGHVSKDFLQEAFSRSTCP